MTRMPYHEDSFNSGKDALQPWKRTSYQFPIGYEVRQKKGCPKENEKGAITRCNPFERIYKELMKGFFFGRTSDINDSESITRRSNEAGSNMNYNPPQSTSSFSKPNSNHWPSTFEQALEEFRKNRGSSPAESHESGFSSVSEPSSTLSDMMNISNIGTTIGQGSVSASTTPPINSGLPSCPYELPVLASPFSLDNIWSVSSDLNSNWDDLDSIERAARLHRIASDFSEVNRNWNGPLPPRSNKNNKDMTYSCKVFLGGVPRNISEAELIEVFAPFGPVEIVSPAKHNHGTSCSSKSGYNYIIFESEMKVKEFLQACTHFDYSDGDSWYFKISYGRFNSIEVQVIPWLLNDRNYVNWPLPMMDPGKTIFVGGLHGTINAESLGIIMNHLFGDVIRAHIDTDKYGYPIGSGLVTFDNEVSFIKAVCAAFMEIKTPVFKKRVQLDPYITGDAMCSGCKIVQGPIFCRDLQCFRYFCHSCWNWQHCIETFANHKPMMRTKRNRQVN